MNLATCSNAYVYRWAESKRIVSNFQSFTEGNQWRAETPSLRPEKTCHISMQSAIRCIYLMFLSHLDRMGMHCRDNDESLSNFTICPTAVAQRRRKQICFWEIWEESCLFWKCVCVCTHICAASAWEGKNEKERERENVIIRWRPCCS